MNLKDEKWVIATLRLIEKKVMMFDTNTETWKNNMNRKIIQLRKDLGLMHTHTTNSLRTIKYY